MLEHGGNVRHAVGLYGRALEDWVDLSTGINPHPYPAPWLTGDAWHRLPDFNPRLLEVAQEYYDAPQLLPVAGTQAAIQALPRLRAHSRVVVAAPSYAEHAHCWRRAGHAVREVEYIELEDAVTRCDVLVVCNPNNPTGATIAPADLLRWADYLAKRGGWLVVDEAFGDTVPGLSVASSTQRPGLIVLRSIGKFFGLAGVRLGFVAARHTLLMDLAEILGPWTVSGPAQQIGAAALEDRTWQVAMRQQLSDSSARLREMLQRRRIHANGTSLFQWWPEPHAISFAEHMAHRGLWVRHFPGHTGGIRLGLPGSEDGWERLDAALDEWLVMKETR